ncbi:hypothetical protein I4F81_006676 [Pyropia yezoensis]|uniref:Uncharacterized protein n=1 Tax=Pyropia yezoensis TaxID=2788 RepID=A0ACC3C2Y7_PYRYE|nr:hypothetical protein I4F81_006676 [Neopyropia yezoensis]
MPPPHGRWRRHGRRRWWRGWAAVWGGREPAVRHPYFTEGGHGAPQLGGGRRRLWLLPRRRDGHPVVWVEPLRWPQAGRAGRAGRAGQVLWLGLAGRAGRAGRAGKVFCVWGVLVGLGGGGDGGGQSLRGGGGGGGSNSPCRRRGLRRHPPRRGRLTDGGGGRPLSPPPPPPRPACGRPHQWMGAAPGARGWQLGRPGREVVHALRPLACAERGGCRGGGRGGQGCWGGPLRRGCFPFFFSMFVLGLGSTCLERGLGRMEVCSVERRETAISLSLPMLCL